MADSTIQSAASKHHGTMNIANSAELAWSLLQK